MIMVRLCIALFLVLIALSCSNDEVRPLKYNWAGENLDCQIHMSNGLKKRVECFSNNGTLLLKHGYKDDLPNGEFESYYEDGKLKERGSLCNGEFCGISKTFYKNGKLKSRSYYLDKEDDKVSSLTYFKDFSIDGKLVGSHIPKAFNFDCKDDVCAVEVYLPFSEYEKPCYLVVIDETSSFTTDKDTLLFKENRFTINGSCLALDSCLIEGVIYELDFLHPDMKEDTIAFFEFKEQVLFKE